ncbi:MAG: VOC family protein [Pseudomonadales bacterium]|nr:VOC family protein [Pseudomonadales bacterium]
MANKGLHHLGLATHDMDATLAFYEDILGFETKVCDLMQPQAGGTIRHAFLDAGNDELIAFMECNDVPGIPNDFDTGLNRGLGIQGGVVHFAFRVDDEEELSSKREELVAKGVTVTDVVDHGWCQSIYFRDPNQLQLEFCCLSREFGDDLLADRTSAGWQALSESP